MLFIKVRVLTVLTETNMAIKDIRSQSGWAKYGPVANGTKTATKSYTLWKSMKQRCFEPASLQRHPTYKGCTISENFQNFQFFAEWCQTQIGYGLEGYHIDKDILVAGNKMYSEDVCVFVPGKLNRFLNNSKAARTIYPQGVGLASCGKFAAALNIDGKDKHIGLYSTPELAFAAYKIAKEMEARRWHQRLKTGEFIVDQRVIERMAVWQLA